MPSLTVEAVGYGAGTMDLPGTPNILRCFLGATANDATGDETVLQVETTIDDMSPQLYEPLIERLFGAGALDVFLQPVIMKRGRPGIVVTALCAPDRVSDRRPWLRQPSPFDTQGAKSYPRTPQIGSDLGPALKPPNPGG